MRFRTSVVAGLFLGAALISVSQMQQTTTFQIPTARTVTVFAAASPPLGLWRFCPQRDRLAESAQIL